MMMMVMTILQKITISYPPVFYDLTEISSRPQAPEN